MGGGQIGIELGRLDLQGARDGTQSLRRRLYSGGRGIFVMPTEGGLDKIRGAIR